MSVLKTLRAGRGLSQAELARRAGVSRQTIGAIEAGRHLPRVDAALAIATALSVDVAALFAAPKQPLDLLSGDPNADGSAVRIGRVGARVITMPAQAGTRGFDAADGVVDNASLTEFGQLRPGLVVAGCEPGLAVIESILREGAMAALAATASTSVALAALSAGRTHAAVVHGADPSTYLEVTGGSVVRFGMARWQVGIVAPADSPKGWWQKALSGRAAVVQREAGAGVQQTFESAVGHAAVPGPRVASHLEAAHRANVLGLPAVTIEPAARALGLEFHPLETHTAELWVAAEWWTDPAVTSALDLVAGARYQKRLAAVGGYDLSNCGERVA